MSREIKFRCWFKNEMSQQMLYDERPGDCLVWKNQGQDIEAIMQFTGLHDKNGKEIYEGDIVQFTVNSFGSNGIERNLNKGAVYYNEDMTLSVDGWMLSRIKSKEVIGNIYENPELLEVSES